MFACDLIKSRRVVPFMLPVVIIRLLSIGTSTTMKKSKADLFHEKMGSRGFKRHYHRIFNILPGVPPDSKPLDISSVLTVSLSRFLRIHSGPSALWEPDGHKPFLPMVFSIQSWCSFIRVFYIA
jgi:hypothetical protein